MSGRLRRLAEFLLLSHKGDGSRYWEVDALRGLAILLMASYHFVFDLTMFGYYPTNVFRGAWRIYGRSSAILFLLIVGLSLWLGHARAHQTGWQLYKKYLVRGLKIAGWGMVISLVSWAYIGQPVIIFGILQLIGCSIIIAYPFLKLGFPNLVLGVILIGLGLYLNSLPVSFLWLLWLGLYPRGLYQLDYFPLLPWFGLVLIGIFAGQTLYPGGLRRFELPSLDRQPGFKPLVWMGQRSLAIYLIHQPIFFAVFFLWQQLASA